MSTSDLRRTAAAGASRCRERAARPSVCLIVNPAAGGGRAGRAAPGVVDALRGHGLTVRREDTRDLDHARELALGAARGGELAVTLGGDGLAGAAADALRACPARSSACCRAGAATTSRACSASGRTRSRRAR